MYDLCCILHNDLFSLFVNRTLALEISHEVTNKFSCRILSLLQIPIMLQLSATS